MSGSAKEWLIVLVFFLAFFAFTFAETYWLNKRTSAGFTRTLLFSFASNILCITVGFFVSFIIIGVILAMAWGDSLQNAGVGDKTIWTALITAMIFPTLFLTVVKRIFIKLMKFEFSAAWIYSLVASLLFILTVFGSSIAVGFLF